MAGRENRKGSMYLVSGRDQGGGALRGSPADRQAAGAGYGRMTQVSKVDLGALEQQLVLNSPSMSLRIRFSLLSSRASFERRRNDGRRRRKEEPTRLLVEESVRPNGGNKLSVSAGAIFEEMKRQDDEQEEGKGALDLPALALACTRPSSDELPRAVQ
jgi:hypothetical protein